MYFDVSKRGKIQIIFDIKFWSYASAQELLTDRLTFQLCAVGITLSVITHPCSPGITNQDEDPTLNTLVAWSAYVGYLSRLVSV